MRPIWSAITALSRLGVTAESDAAHTQQVTQTNSAALFSIVAAIVAGLALAATGLYGSTVLAAISVLSSSCTFLLNVRGHVSLASMWLTVTIDVALVGMALFIGVPTVHAVSYFACGLPLFLFPASQWRSLLIAFAVTAVAFLLLTWPDLLPPPQARVSPDDLDALKVLMQILSWSALLCLVVSFAVNRNRANARLRGTLHRAQVASATKSAFLAHTSHELRTPMGAILGYADLLVSPQITAEERANFVRTIRRNGRHLLELVDQLLDHAKIEAGQLDIARAVCSPERIVADVEALMEVRANAKGLELCVEYETRIPELIETDELRVRQILVNLVGNAIKFTASGRVYLVVTLERADGLAELRFAVIDEGPGIPAERLPAMFEPYTQADMSTQRNHGGTGLGLAISKELAELLGGRLEAESTVDVGSTFTFALALGPVDELAELVDARVSIEPTVVRPRPLDSMAGARILIAEDGIDNQRLMELYLRQVGAQCVIAANGARAVQAYQQSVADKDPFDVVLMDMQMPEMDGYQATRELREIGCQIPIIALTAHAMVGAREECMRAGCDSYFTKPIDFEALFARLQEYLEAQTAPIPPQRRSARSGTGDDAASQPDPAPAVEDTQDETDSGSVKVPVFRDPTARFHAQLAVLNRDFARRLPERVAELTAAAAAGDYEQVRFLAHRLRGTAGTFGLARVSELAGKITSALDHSGELSREASAADHQGEAIALHLDELVNIAKQASLA